MWGSVGLFVKLIKLALTGRGWDWNNIPCTMYTPCHDNIDERDGSYPTQTSLFR